MLINNTTLLLLLLFIVDVNADVIIENSAKISGNVSTEKLSQVTTQPSAVYEGIRYKVFEAAFSWHQAERYCLAQKGSLVSIKNRQVDGFIFKLSAGRTLWIGATDQQTEGKWLWQDGSEVVYSHWASQEPDNWKNGEDWAAIGWTSFRFSGGKWADTAAHFRAPLDGFICQWPI